MEYQELYRELKDKFDVCTDAVTLPELNIKINKYNFYSEAADLLPGINSYTCSEHQSEFYYDNTPIKEHPLIDYHDRSIDSNKSFQYSIISPLHISRTKGVIFLFHGLNEKKWHKYLPWAYELVNQTKKAVILFPLAFHMERAPNSWSEFRLMQKVAADRNSLSGNSQSSFVNAAISARLEADPQRIFWSGFQTYMDVCVLIKSIRNGEVNNISADASFDLFGYSIGAFFSILLLMANPMGQLSNSRFFSFCGAATLDRMYPISKYIMDLKASIVVETFFEEQLINNFINEKRLAHYLNGLHPEQSNFKSILNYRFFKDIREKRISEIADRIYAVVLKKDEVVPPHEVLNTLKGALRDIESCVEILDFDFPYNHVTPFPVNDKIKQQVNSAFREVMDKACRFLN